MGGKRLEIVCHHSIKEIEKRMKDSKDAVEYKHWLIIKLLIKPKQEKSPEEVAEIVGVTYDWIRKLIHKYNKEGEKALGDSRLENAGVKPILNEEEQKELFQILCKPAPDGGLWTGPKVAKWIEEKKDRQVNKEMGWHYLKRLGFQLRKPRPKNIKAATCQEKKEFKKNRRIS